MRTHEIAVDDARRVHIFESSQNLVEEVLDELLLEGAGGEEAVEVGAEELSNKVAAMRSGAEHAQKRRHAHVLEGRDEDVAEADDLRGCQSKPGTAEAHARSRAGCA